MYAVFIHSTSLGTVSFKLFKFLCHLSSNMNKVQLSGCVAGDTYIWFIRLTSENRNSIMGIKTLYYFEITASCKFAC